MDYLINADTKTHSLDIFKPCDKCGGRARIHRVQWVEKLKLSILYKCPCGCKFTYHKHTKYCK